MQIFQLNCDKIEALREYLISNSKEDEGDSWTFGHHPIIEDHLMSLTEAESIKLQAEIFNWSEDEKYRMADPMSETKNKYIDGQYVYGKIFLSIQDFEKLEYLVQNLCVIVWESIQKRPFDFYVHILKKVKILNEQLDNGYIHLIGIIEDKIEKERADNNVPEKLFG